MLKLNRKEKKGYERFRERGNLISLGYLPNLSKPQLEDAISQLDTFVATKRDYSLIPERFKQLFHTL